MIVSPFIQPPREFESAHNTPSGVPYNDRSALVWVGRSGMRQGEVKRAICRRRASGPRDTAVLGTKHLGVRCLLRCLPFIIIGHASNITLAKDGLDELYKSLGYGKRLTFPLRQSS